MYFIVEVVEVRVGKDNTVFDIYFPLFMCWVKQGLFFVTSVGAWFPFRYNYQYVLSAGSQCTTLDG
jgi:hypothetical protein